MFWAKRVGFASSGSEGSIHRCISSGKDMSGPLEARVLLAPSGRRGVDWLPRGDGTPLVISRPEGWTRGVLSGVGCAGEIRG